MIHKVGNRIGSLRKDRNMSQEELAAIVSVSRQTISKWETGDSLPDVYNAVALANLFHISLDSLILGSKIGYTSSSYMVELKDKRQKFNLKAMIIGSIGSTLFVLSIVLTRTLGLDNPEAGYLYMVVMPILMLCWGYAIWNFIKIGRIGEEIKYLEKIELENLRNKVGP
jgi:transcriptional regulator with XRE-family HTH domain